MFPYEDRRGNVLRARAPSSKFTDRAATNYFFFKNKNKKEDEWPCKMRPTVAFILIYVSNRCNAFLVHLPSALLKTDVAGSFSSGFYASDGDENENSDSVQEKLDSFLDTPFFDPKNKDNGFLLKWFADLVESDYELAEALYVGLIFVILVVGAQELLRMQMYGDTYVPFHPGVGGRLW